MEEKILERCNKILKTTQSILKVLNQKTCENIEKPSSPPKQADTPKKDSPEIPSITPPNDNTDPSMLSQESPSGCFAYLYTYEYKISDC